MRTHKLILCAIASVAFSAYVAAQPLNQTARRVQSANALPAACFSSTNVKDLIWQNSVGLSVCTSSGVWTGLATVAGTVPSTRTISTTAPLSGGGDLSADRTLTCTTCATHADNLSVFSSTTSAQLAALISDETGGAGVLVFNSSPTIVTPTIASFANATHNHQNAAGGGTLVDAAITFTAPALGAPTATTIQTSGNIGLGVAPSSTAGILVTATNTANSATVIQVTNADASDTGSEAQFKTAADTATLFVRSHGTGRTTSRFGSAIGGWDEIITGAGSGLKLGTSSTVPVIIGTNATRALTIDGTSQAVSLKGTATNDSPTAGDVGEYQSGTVAANTTSLSTGTTANVGASTNITLTAGDWDCTGAINFTFGATTSITNLAGGISTTTATLPAQDSYFDYETSAIVPTSTAVATWVVPTVRLSLSGSTSVFLVSQATFSVSTIKVGGTIRCRRMR